MSLCGACRKVMYFAVHPEPAKLLQNIMVILVFCEWVLSSLSQGPGCKASIVLALVLPIKVLWYISEFSFWPALNMGHYHNTLFDLALWYVPVYCQFLANVLVHAADKKKKKDSNLVMALLKPLASSLPECYGLLAKTVSYTQMAWNAFYFVTCVIDHWNKNIRAFSSWL